MSKTKRFLKLTAFAAAVMMAAGMSLTVCPGTLTPLTVSADAEYADEPSTFGSNGTFNYQKFSDHIFITGAEQDMDSVEIPSSIDGVPVTGIGIYAFQYSKMRSLTLPDTIEVIGMYTFTDCPNLTSVKLPDSVKRIKLHAFENCSALSEIIFPDHLVETAEYTFENTPWLDAQRQKDPLVIVNGAVIDGRTCKGEVKIPSTVKYVAAGAFQKNEDITSVTVPSGVKAIEPNTFWYCSNLASAEVNGAESLEFGAFAACNKLTDLKLSGKLKKIDNYAFTDNTATATITFYGTEEMWNQVDKNADDEFLKRAKMVFDPNGAPADPDDPDVPDDPTVSLLGDVNEDTAVDVEDVVLLARFLTEDETAVVSRTGALNADVNRNGTPDSDDASKILCFIAKLIGEF